MGETMAEYQLFVQKEYDRANGFYGSYGISVLENGTLIQIVRDLSPDRSAVERLVSVFNENALDPVHLTQAVEEFLYDFEG